MLQELQPVQYHYLLSVELSLVTQIELVQHDCPSAQMSPQLMGGADYLNLVSKGDHMSLVGGADCLNLVGRAHYKNWAVLVAIQENDDNF